MAIIKERAAPVMSELGFKAGVIKTIKDWQQKKENTKGSCSQKVIYALNTRNAQGQIVF